MSAPSAPRVVLAATAVFVALALALVGPPPAHADDPVFDRAFGAGPADLCTTACRTGTNGGGAGQLNLAYGAAISGGELYVVDANQRVSVYGTNGTFARAFGKNVNAGGGNADMCTSATTCKPGTTGGGAGQLNNPYAIAVSGGEVYVADASNNRVSVYSTAGVFSRAFGKNVNATGGNPDICSAACQPGMAGGAPGQLSFPLGIGMAGGQVYVADASNNRVNVYDTAGAFVRSFGELGSGAGQLSFPFGLAVSGGEVYVADQNNQRVSVFATDGTFARAFGRNVNPSLGSPDVCTALTTCRAGTLGAGAGQLRTPLGVAVGAGEVYVVDASHRINVFATDGTFARAFGSSVNPDPSNPDLCTTATACQSGSPGGASGQLNNPTAVALSTTEAFVADTSNYRVGVYSTAGVFARAFGKGVSSASPFVCTTATGCGPGSPGAAAGQFNLPFGVAVGGGEAYVADPGNRRIGVYSADGAFSRAIGKNVNAGAGNPDVCTSATTCRAGLGGSGPGELGSPAAVAFSGGEVYVADQSNHRVSVFGADGTFSRTFGSLGGGAGELDNPVAITVSGGEVYVTDQGNRRISVFSTGGTFARAFGRDVNPGAGNPDICTAATACRAGTLGDAAGQLSSPFGVTVSGGQVYVADHFNARISVYGTGGAFVRAFGKSVSGGTGNPDVCTTATTCRAGSLGGAAGQINFPFGVAVGDGAVYISERFSGRVSVFGTDGAFARAFGTGVNPTGNGNLDVCTPTTGCRSGAQGDAAGQLTEPVGLAMSGTRIYIADRGNHRISVFRVPRTEISRDPVALAFGARDIDDGATAGQTSTITNTGTERVTLTSLELSGDAGHFARLSGFAGDCAVATALDAGQTCNLRVRFDPTSTGAKNAMLTVGSNAPTITVALTGTGTQTQLARAPASLDFGARDLDDGPAALQTSTITNTGSESVTLAALTLSGDTTQFARLTGAPGDCTATTTLGPTQNCIVRLRFDPSSIGLKSATLTVTSAASPLTIGLTGSGTQTELSRAPAALGFGARDVDDGPAPVQTSTLSNTGSETITLTGLTLSGAPDFARLTGAPGDCTATTQLAAGESCAVRIRFDPATTGAKAANVAVTSNAAALAIALSGSGIQTRLVSDAAAFAFGPRDLPAPPLDRSTTIANTGTETVTLTALTLTGDATHFARLTGEPGDCAPATQLDAGESCTVRVRFDPTTTGAKSATLTVASNAPGLPLPLTGSGTHVELSRAPAALSFGTRDVDTGATAIQTSTLTNTGSDDVTIASLTVSGDATHFVRLSESAGDCTIARTLEAGESCALRLRFDPTSGGAKAATLTVGSNAAPVGVALTGSGIQTQLSSDPPSLAFGSRDIDEGATGQTATIANTGTEPVTLSGLVLSGDTADFARVTGVPAECSAITQLDAGETCTYRIRFDPATTGAKSATLTVTSNAAALTIGLTGNGTTTKADHDGDGTPDTADTDDDNDGVPDDQDAFPRNPAETLDTDADGTGNNADPDDDNDGAPDERDAYPLDPTRQTVDPTEPVAPVTPTATTDFGPWQLKRIGRVRVTSRRGVVTVDSGHAAVCPKGGSPCTGRLTLKFLRRSTRGRKTLPIFLTGKSRPMTIAPGTRLRLTFRLSARGIRVLRRRGPLSAVMRGSVSTDGHPGVVRRARLRLVAPGSAAPAARAPQG
ncbi:MAG TPA: choice-of-anchor D domain-containing protein, partial [Solirubrobacteraceae bacterium]|nr:choice-of-anchor D domain-containing protein [Solirubrobacteraceae bacterium]